MLIRVSRLMNVPVTEVPDLPVALVNAALMAEEAEAEAQALGEWKGEPV